MLDLDRGIISLVVFGNFGFDGLVSFMLDDVSLICFTMLFFCGVPSLMYCSHYFVGSGSVALLYSLMVWFLGVMLVLVFTCRVLATLVFWEYLGLVSFFLILFYRNSVRLRASLVTLFVSRFGDVALFFVVAWC